MTLRDASEEERGVLADGFGGSEDILAGEACTASVGRPRLLVPVRSPSGLARLDPDPDRLRASCDRLGLLGCYLHTIPTAEGRLAARMFAPSIGVPEDVANANSAACLAARLAGRETTTISVDMGDAVGSPATIAATSRRSPRGLEATVVTSSPDVALALRDHPTVEVDLLGGRLHRMSQTVTGVDAIAQLQALRPDVCLVSGCGVHPDIGVTFRERDEAQVVRTMIGRSARTIVLASADKLGSASPYVVAPAGGIDVLVIDAPHASVGDYERLGVAVVTPEASTVAAA